MTPEQIETLNNLDNLEAQARAHDEPLGDAPLPWRVSHRGNVIAANGEVVLRPTGVDKRERRRRARLLVDAANNEHVRRSEELALALDAARARWAEVAPPEPRVVEINVNGQRFEFTDNGGLTALQLTAAMNAAFADSGHVASTAGNSVQIAVAQPEYSIEIEGGSAVSDLGLNFSRFDFGFLAGRP